MNIFERFIKTKSTSIPRYILEQVLFLVLQMIPTLAGMVLRGVFYKLIVQSKGVLGVEENVQLCHARNIKAGKNVFIGRNSYLGASDGGIVLGDEACLLDSCYLNVFNFNNESGGKAKIVIGKKVVLSHGCTIHAHSGVTIGENTIVGPNSVLVTGNHGDISANARYRDAEIKRDAPIVIGANVWIGTNVTILPGVRIGDSSVVGAGSVVTKDIAANSVVAGNPAKVMRELN